MSCRQQTLVWCVAALFMAACVGNVEAQGRRNQGPDGPPGGPPPGGFPGGPGGPGGMMGGPGGMGMMGGMFGGRAMSRLMLLGREDVQKNMELVDDQLEQLAKVREGLDMRQMWGQLRDLPEEERAAKTREMMESMQRKIEEQVDDILLPHQSERLTQLAMQWQLRGPGGLVNEEVARDLGITEDQREKLRTKERELRRQAEKQVMDDLLKELTPEQQAKFKESVGEPLEFEVDERFGGFGRGGPGAPGGRGGAGGAGGRGGRRGGN